MKLNQIIAVEKGVKARATSTISELYKLIQKGQAFDGLVREYHPKDDDGDTLPGERKVVQARVPEVLGALRISESEFLDVAAQREKGNTIASASVVVDGKTILADLPVGTLLMLEKRLTDLRTFIDTLPTLDISEAWGFDAAGDIYKTQAVQTHRTVKSQRPIVLYDATDKHPAQTQLITSDEIAGYWHTIKQSGAIPRAEKLALLARADKLLIAVKQAREAANSVDVPTGASIGAAIFEFILGRTA
jgi:hypothetical protein